MRFIIYFVIFLTNIYPQTKFKIESFNYGIQTKSLENNKEIFSKTSDLFFLGGIYSKQESQNFSHEVDFQIGGNKEKFFFYPNENTFFQFSKGTLNIFFGRKQHILKRQFLSWKDGIEGIGMDFTWRENWKIQFNALDYYRAYPLLEKEFALENKDKSKGHRFRHGVEFGFKNEVHSAFFSFQYLNLGNWGRYSNEVLEAKSGDRDFLYELGLQYEFRNNFFLIGLGCFLVRGLDKTQSHEIRSNKSLPFSGELVTAKLGLNLDFFFFNWRGFLPDRNKTNKQGEILESGYIGMGTYPFKGVILGQVLQFYPSAWVRSSGLSIESGFINAYRYSFVSEIELGIKDKTWKLIFFGTNCIPYLENGTKKGSMRPFREEFSKYYLNEWGAEFFYNFSEIEGGFLSFQVSQLVTSKEIGWNSTAAYIKGGIFF
jgi:hypothetical protein